MSRFAILSLAVALLVLPTAVYGDIRPPGSDPWGTAGYPPPPPPPPPPSDPNMAYEPFDATLPENVGANARIIFDILLFSSETFTEEVGGVAISAIEFSLESPQGHLFEYVTAPSLGSAIPLGGSFLAPPPSPGQTLDTAGTFGLFMPFDPIPAVHAGPLIRVEIEAPGPLPVGAYAFSIEGSFVREGSGVAEELFPSSVYTLNIVPEPSTFFLAAIGLLSIGWRRRK